MLAPTIIHHLRQPWSAMIAPKCFQHSQGKGFSHWESSESGQIKTVLEVGSSRNPPDRSNHDNSLGMRFCRSSNPTLSPLVASGLLAFTLMVGCGLLIFRSTVELGWRDGNRASWIPATKLIVLSKVHPFFLNKCLPDCCKPLLNFQSSEIVDFDNLGQFPHCFYRGKNFLRFLFHHFCWCQLSLIKRISQYVIFCVLLL